MIPFPLVRPFSQSSPRERLQNVARPVSRVCFSASPVAKANMRTSPVRWSCTTTGTSPCGSNCTGRTGREVDIVEATLPSGAIVTGAACYWHDALPRPELAFASPRKLPRPRELKGRVVVLDVAFASEASSGGFEKITLPVHHASSARGSPAGSTTTTTGCTSTTAATRASSSPRRPSTEPARRW